jgi:ribosome biogenesis GTPase
LLETFGWTDGFASSFHEYEQDGFVPGRVVVEEKDAFVVRTEHGETHARLAGRFRQRQLSEELLPTVGDFVALDERDDGWSLIQGVVQRKTAFIRSDPSRATMTQVLAANFETVWIFASLTAELSARRVEHFLAVAWSSGAQPVVVLTKADLDAASAERLAEVESVAIGCPIHITSAVTGDGIDELTQHLAGDRTAVILGASGVGKSTLINYLLGEERLATQPTRADDVGRHTTTHRELVKLPAGGMLIDTPGLREIGVWSIDGTDTLFEDITRLVSECRFANCKHRTEPDCAIKAALAAGEIDEGHIKAYYKMLREMRFLARRKKYKGGIDWRRDTKRKADVKWEDERYIADA